ncbi:CRISPR-associated protein Cas2 [Lactobacillus colini]|uniref:CRISPR-associated endoribonuclease Cas2 n=1 Tax=Lactobacillus colini TaxID=1819254 RepID=A0ABS4MGZ1_9LACO|nr:CRISPR-associated endonuclease Cas2 [Lactobacillus colini]MBP2058974.1 CRISPR-associated protein Cas2 [Lactobacillus colini]
MMVIVSYDVNTKDTAGKKRLRHVAKICQDYGQRVQNSVFECLVNNMQLEILKNKLLSEIDEEYDSLYFFNIGSRYHNKIFSYGCKTIVDLDGPVIF